MELPPQLVVVVSSLGLIRPVSPAALISGDRETKRLRRALRREMDF